MPELPDVVVYVDCLKSRVVDRRLEGVRVANPFVLRSVTPTLDALAGRLVTSVRRLGKRVVIGLKDDVFIVVHLMIAGRFRWRQRGHEIPKKLGLAAFDFSTGTLLLTQAGSIKRASIHLVRGTRGLEAHDRGGLEILDVELTDFRDVLLRENHTLKRALTDPRLFSGVGNAYSDEILHAAGLSPLRLTNQLEEAEVARLHAAARTTLLTWVERIRSEVGDGFPERVTAFRDGMAVHGRYQQPCPVCESPIQRIVYARNEANYCASCQTGGKLLADRAMSRLLRRDWPRTLEEWEDRRR